LAPTVLCESGKAPTSITQIPSIALLMKCVCLLAQFTRATSHLQRISQPALAVRRLKACGSLTDRQPMIHQPTVTTVPCKVALLTRLMCRLDQMLHLLSALLIL